MVLWVWAQPKPNPLIIQVGNVNQSTCFVHEWCQWEFDLWSNWIEDVSPHSPGHGIMGLGLGEIGEPVEELPTLLFYMGRRVQLFCLWSDVTHHQHIILKIEGKKSIGTITVFFSSDCRMWIEGLGISSLRRDVVDGSHHREVHSIDQITRWWVLHWQTWIICWNKSWKLSCNILANW